MVSKPAISIEIGSYNRKSLLKLTVDSVRKELENFAPGYEIIVVDGGSTDGALQWLCKQKDIILIVQHNRGSWKGKPIVRRSAGYFHNLAYKIAQGKYICPLSDDCLIVPGSIINAYKLFEEKIKKGEKIGQLSFYTRILPTTDRSYHVRLAFGEKMYAGFGLYLKQAIEEVNYLDEDSYFFYYIETDLSLKLWQKGWAVEAAPDSYIEHYVHSNLKVRRGNISKIQEDFTNLLAKWEGTFYYESNKEKGKFDRVIEKEYFDKNYTAKKFGYRRYLYSLFKIKMSNTLSAHFPVLKNKLSNFLRRF